MVRPYVSHIGPTFLSYRDKNKQIFKNYLKIMESEPEPKKAQFGNRFLTNPDDVFQHNSW